MHVSTAMTKYCSRFLISILFMMFATISFGWSGHETYTYIVVNSLGIDVNELVEITKYSYVENRVYNEPYYYKDDFAGTRKFFDSLGDGKFPPDPKPVDNKLPAWQILTIYAQMPDFGMDEGLNLSPLQALIGNSQGVRHMRYKIGIIEAFEGNKSFVYFVNMSQKAFNEGDRYWGYRFLSYAVHYMEDLFQPYHESPGSIWEVLGSVTNKSVNKMLNNAHYAYDNYLLFLMYYSKHTDEIRKLIEETPARRVPSNYDALMEEVMMYGYSKSHIVHDELKKAFGDILYQRTPTIEDFKNLEEIGKLDKLYSTTKDIIATMTGTVKGFLVTYIKENQK